MGETALLLAMSKTNTGLTSVVKLPRSGICRSTKGLAIIILLIRTRLHLEGRGRVHARGNACPIRHIRVTAHIKHIAEVMVRVARSISDIYDAESL